MNANVAWVNLSQGQFAAVDANCPLWVLNAKWTAVWSESMKSFYASRSVGGTTQYLHRALTGYSMVDHINHDTLDNRQTNLREVTPQQNQWNKRPMRGSSSKYKGVGWRSDKNKWDAQIRTNGKRRFLGYYEVEEQAAVAYDKAASELFGEFAWLNSTHFDLRGA